VNIASRVAGFLAAKQLASKVQTFFCLQQLNKMML
jgi:hypothetical protein